MAASSGSTGREAAAALSPLLRLRRRHILDRPHALAAIGLVADREEVAPGVGADGRVQQRARRRVALVSMKLSEYPGSKARRRMVTKPLLAISAASAAASIDSASRRPYASRPLPVTPEANRTPPRPVLMLASIRPVRASHRRIVLSSEPEARARLPSISSAARLVTGPYALRGRAKHFRFAGPSGGLCCQKSLRRGRGFRRFGARRGSQRGPHALRGRAKPFRFAGSTGGSCCRLSLRRGRGFHRFRARRGT